MNTLHQKRNNDDKRGYATIQKEFPDDMANAKEGLRPLEQAAKKEQNSCKITMNLSSGPTQAGGGPLGGAHTPTPMPPASLLGR